jgi:hypothetical protein
VSSTPLRQHEFEEGPSLPDDARLLEAPEILLDEPGCLMASWRNITIVVWATRATLRRAERLAQIGTEQLRLHPRGGSTIHLVIDGAALPDAETRAALEAMATQFEDKLACVLTVLAGSGFWASAMRGLVTSLFWLRSTKYLPHIAATHQEAARWFCQHHTARTKVYVGTSEYNRLLDGLLEAARKVPDPH